MNITLSFAGMILSLMVFSLLLGTRSLFRLAAYLLVGISAGYLINLLLLEVLIPRLTQGDGTTPRMLLLIPLALGLIMLLRTSSIPLWIRRIPMAFLLGCGAAVTVGGAVYGTLLGQVMGTARGLFDQPVWSALVLLAGTLSVLAAGQYFLRRPDPAKPPAEKLVPDWLQMVTPFAQIFTGLTLGAIYAGVLISALSSFAERWQSIYLTLTILLGSL